MIIPWNTDAPVYHFPLATIGLIVANTVVFVAVISGENPDVAQWALVYGDGLHPLQWISSTFLHAGLLHLVGNMIFLWGFGLVVEGKIGWWRFLAVYFGIGIVQCALEQSLTQNLVGGSMGASAILYGLMAMAMIWAPRNEMSCVAFIWRVSFFDIPILAFAALYVGLELFWLWMADFAVSSAMLHLSGAILGFAVAVVMLKFDWVDCENWDLFSVLAGHEGQPRERKRRADSPPLNRSRPEIDPAEAHLRISELLTSGKVEGAIAVHAAMIRADADWQLNETELLGLIKALHAHEEWAASIPYMVECLTRWPQRSDRIRLRLAQILISQQRPQQALDVLAKIAPGSLDAKLESARRSLEQRANQVRQSGVMELETHDW